MRTYESILFWIIEDDPDIAESVKYNLERDGFTAVVALSGEQGLTQALSQQQPPVLIILDLMLPGLSGTELCRWLRREPQTRTYSDPDAHGEAVMNLIGSPVWIWEQTTT